MWWNNAGIVNWSQFYASYLELCISVFWLQLIIKGYITRVFPPYITGSGKRTQIPFPMLSIFPQKHFFPILFFLSRKTYENKFELVKILLGNYFWYQTFNLSLLNLLNAIHSFPNVTKRTTQFFPNWHRRRRIPDGLQGKTLIKQWAFYQKLPKLTFCTISLNQVPEA